MKAEDMTYRVGFEMVDPEGTAPMRVVAGHAIRVGEIWQELGAAMFTLADSFDELTADPPQTVTVGVDGKVVES